MIQLVIPLQLPSQNVWDRLHWSRKTKVKRAWIQWLRSAQRPGGPDLAKGPRTVLMVSYRSRLITDEHNLSGGSKGIMDAFKNAGLVLDDRDELAQFIFSQKKAKESPTGKPCTVVEITEGISRSNYCEAVLP